MQKRSLRHVLGGLVVVAIAAAGSVSVAEAQPPGVERKVLLRQDVPIPGYEAVLIAVTLAAGSREGLHTHPGTLLVYVQEGELTLDHESRETVTYKAGESLFVEAGQVHEGMNRGTTTVRGIATLVVEKGKPLTHQLH